MTETVLINHDGTLRNVFVYISAGLEQLDFAAPTSPVVLDQRDCRFVPHVLGLQVAQPLRILNSDNTLHNVHVLAQKNAAFNLGMTRNGPERLRVFDSAEIMVPLRCNVHPWMIAYVAVVEHPFYAITDSAGSFTIARLPAGKYTLAAWHEELGTLAQTVELTAADKQTIDFTFQANGASRKISD